MSKVNPQKAQDVWKDAGKSVQFIILKLNRTNQSAELEAVRDFVDRFQAIGRSLKIRDQDQNLKMTLGFSNAAWDYLFPGKAKPQELETYQEIKGDKYSMPAAIDGDLFIHVRANEEAVVYEAVRQMTLFAKQFATVLDETAGFRYLEGRAIIEFIDGTENPQLEDAADYAIIGNEDPTFINGSYAFAQKWKHDMANWDALSTEEQEKAVGRRKYSDLELADDEKYKNAHNVASKAVIDGVEQKIVRMNVAYSDPARENTGTYFIGYARHWNVTKTMLKNMVAKHDYLLSFSKILYSDLFFIPSRDLLDQIAAGDF